MKDITKYLYMLASDDLKADEEEYSRIRTCNEELHGDDLKAMLINWLDYLRDSRDGLATLCLSHGKLWEIDEVVKNVKLQTKGDCLKNATQLAFADNSLTYVEGYACPAGFPVPTRHAWVVNQDGLVIDNTWENGQLYLGLIVNTSTLGRCFDETRSWGVYDYKIPKWVLSEYFSSTTPFQESSHSQLMSKAPLGEL
jgi:hypothetical protein